MAVVPSRDGGAMLDVSKYVEESKAGTTKLVLIAGKLHYVEKQFHPKTGEATPAVIPVDIKTLKAALEQNAKDRAAFEAMIIDAEAAQEHPALTGGK